MTIVLVVGNNNEMSRFARTILAEAGYVVYIIDSATEAIRRAKENRPTLIVVDTTAIGRQAIEMSRRIRRLPSLARTQLIFIADEVSEEERILGFESGVDDYITGPVSGAEFLARVRAVLRRLDRSQTSSSSLNSIQKPPHGVQKSGEFEIDLMAMKVFIHGREILTTSLEFRLIRYLAENYPRVFTRDQLLDAVWGANQFVSPRAVDAVVRRIRTKIEPASSRPTYLKTIRGVGYRLDQAVIQKAVPDQLASNTLAS